MAIWRYTQEHDPATYCENLSISLRDFGSLLSQLYEGYGGGSVFEFDTFPSTQRWCRLRSET